MSFNTTTDGSALPSGVTTTTDLSSSLSILLVGTVGSSFLVPISTVLLYLQTPRAHRSPQFLMILASLVLGLGEGGLNMYNQISAIRHTAVPTAVTTTYTMVHLFLPLLTESVLVFRVTAMHPPKRIPRYLRALIYVPIAILKIARVVVLIAIAISWIANSRGLPAPVQGGLDALTAVNKLPSQVRWALQVADTLFMSVMFFPRSGSKAKKHAKKPKGGRAAAVSESHHTQDTQDPADEDEQLPLWPRLKTLFWNAVSSFVIPVLLNLVQFVLVLVQNGVLHFPSLFAVNNQVGIIGMVFATVLTPSAATARPAPRKTASARAGGGQQPTRPGLLTALSDSSFKEDKEDGSVDSPGLPELLSDDQQAAPANWMTAGRSRAGRDDEQGDLSSGFAGLLDISGRSSPGGGGAVGDLGGMLGGVAGAFGGVDGALDHVGHNLGHVGNWRDRMHEIGGEARSKVHDLEAGLIREERRAVAAVKGKARSMVDGVKHMIHEEVAEAKDEAREAVRGAHDKARGEMKDVQAKARAAVIDMEDKVRTAVDEVKDKARAEVRGVEARVADEETRLRDRTKAEVGLVETRLRDEEMRAEDKAEAKVRVEEARIRDAEAEEGEKMEEEVHVEDARAVEELDAKEKFDM